MVTTAVNKKEREREQQQQPSTKISNNWGGGKIKGNFRIALFLLIPLSVEFRLVYIRIVKRTISFGSTWLQTNTQYRLHCLAMCAFFSSSSFVSFFHSFKYTQFLQVTLTTAICSPQYCSLCAWLFCLPVWAHFRMKRKKIIAPIREK